MEDDERLYHIFKLIDERHELYQQTEKGGLDAREHQQLRQLEANLDRCYDPREHRRVLRETGYDPYGTTVRNEKIVRRGLLAMVPQPGSGLPGRRRA